MTPAARGAECCLVQLEVQLFGWRYRLSSCMSAFRISRSSVLAVLLSLSIAAAMPACSEGGGVNLFTIEDDKALGAQIAAEITENTAAFPILDSLEYARVYASLYALRDVILESGQVTHAQDFQWQIRVIDNDTVINAFCTPGGYIYVYTGLLRYLDDMSQLAGVMAHEMAHADLRHSTDQLTTAYGIHFLLNLVMGENRNMITDIATGLSQLAFSRSDESQADAYAVRYLCSSSYAADGSAVFFERMQTTEGDAAVPEFLSTHPSPSNRAERIREQKQKMGCAGANADMDTYTGMLKALPPKK